MLGNNSCLFRTDTTEKSQTLAVGPAFTALSKSRVKVVCIVDDSFCPKMTHFRAKTVSSSGQKLSSLDSLDSEKAEKGWARSANQHRTVPGSTMDLLNGVINFCKSTVDIILLAPAAAGKDQRKEGQEELFIAEYTEGDKSPRPLVNASPVRAPSAAPSQSSSSIASSEGSAKPNAGQWVQDRNTSWIERHQHLKEQRVRLAAQQCTTQGRLKEVQSHLNKLRKDQSRKDHKKLPEAEFNKTVQRHLVEVNRLTSALKNCHKEAAELQNRHLQTLERGFAVFSSRSGRSPKQARRVSFSLSPVRGSFADPASTSSTSSRLTGRTAGLARSTATSTSPVRRGAK